jgi:predicted transposase/invertase (TIGR01784 family)
MDWNESLKTYQISVLNFIFDNGEQNCINHYFMQNENRHFVSKTLNIIFMELPKIELLPDDISLLTAAQMWGKFFLCASNTEKRDFVDQLIKSNRGIAMAVTVLKNISQDELNWYHETRYWMHVSDMKTMKNAAEQQGLKEGMAKGLAKGRAEGTRENAIASAQNLLKMNLLTYEQIAQAVGLHIEEVKELADQ